VYNVTITASNGTSPNETQAFTLAVDQAPAITSTNSAVLQVGTQGSYTVTKTGYPSPTLSHTGTLPNGVTFNDATGVISGNPPLGTDGVYNLTITAANGIGTNATQSFTLTVKPDNVPPALTISSLPNGTSTSNGLLNLFGTVTDSVGISSLTVNGVSVLLNPDGSFSYPLLLQGGLNTVTTIATDSAGNQTTDTRSVTLDLTLPVLNVTAPADNSTSYQQYVTVTGTIDPTNTVQISVNGGTPGSVAITGSTFTQSVNLVTGMNTLEIFATDLNGRTNTVKRTIFSNSQLATITITPNQDALTTQGSVVITGSIADSLGVAGVKVTSGDTTFTPVVTAGAFSQEIDFSQIQTYPIFVSVTDSAGTTTTMQRNIIYVMPDAVNPVTSPTNTASQTLSGTMQTGTIVTITCPTAVVGTVTYPTASTWTVPLTGLTVGKNVGTVTFTDLSGVVTTIQFTIMFDTSKL